MRRHPGMALSLTSAALLVMCSTAAVFAASNPRGVQVPTNTLQTAWNALINQPGLVHSSVSAMAYDITTHQVLAEINPT